MKKVFLALAIVAAALSTTPAAQQQSGIFPSPPWCAGCFVASSVDQPTGATITGSSRVAGWASNCDAATYGDARITHITATAAANGYPVSVPVAYALNGHRPDVGAYLSSVGCAYTAFAGFAVSFPSGFPEGTTAVNVLLWSEGIYAYHGYYTVSGSTK